MSNKIRIELWENWSAVNATVILVDDKVKEVLFEKGDKYYKILRNVLLNSTSKGMVIRRLYKYDELELRAIERDYSLIDNSISWNCVAWVERRFLEEV